MSYGANAEATTWNVALGIVQAINNGATLINLSLGSSVDSPVLRDLVASAAAKGILIFAAAGNEPVATPFYPAGLSSGHCGDRETGLRFRATPTSEVLWMWRRRMRISSPMATGSGMSSGPPLPRRSLLGGRRVGG